MKIFVLALVISVVLVSSISAQMIFGNVHCKVIDSQTKKPLLAASVAIQDNKQQFSGYLKLTNINGEVDLGVNHTDILIFVMMKGYVSKIVKPASKETIIKLDKISNLNKGKSRRELENLINKVLESTEYAKLSYQITDAIIQGKNFIGVGSTLLNQLPTGSTITVAGFFDMKLRVKNGNLGWVLDGILIQEFVSLGIIPTQPNSF